MATKEAVIKQVQGTTLVAHSESRHWVVMDGSETYGGSSAGSSPKELLMFALGGCTANDVIPILRKKRIPVEKLEIRVIGNVRDEHPRIFTDLHIEYIFYGDDLDTSAIESAIDLSVSKYCAVSAMLSGVVKLTHSYLILPTAQSAVPEKQLA
ncbi:MAG TPA: OsmC family protein [Bacteroidota bacterium]|nr:OsmC family protein [Bacteroidota bacterium]